MAGTPFEFLRSSSPAERRALAASTLGWMLDGMDVTLYAVVIADLLRALRLSKPEAGALASVTLIASALGGILFGVLADRLGRRRALVGSIVVYSIFTAACGLSHSLVELVVFRFLLGLGMGGEWATGAALVAETWRPEHRGKALGVMQSGFAIGYALAAIVAAVVLPRWGWRAVFFVGIAPALVTIWIQWRVEESPLWVAKARIRDSGFGARGSQREEMPGPVCESRNPSPEPRVNRTYGRLILITLLMNSAALFAWWGLFTWVPSYLALPVAEGGRGLTVAASSLWIVVMQAGMWLGYVSFGFASDVLGRKKTYVTYLLLAAGLVPFYARAGAGALLVLGPLLAFFGTGHFTGFGIITAELFPTSFRAFAMGLTYNFGRALSAAAPYTIGLLARGHGLSSAFWISGLAFLIAALLALALPETRARALAKYCCS